MTIPEERLRQIESRYSELEARMASGTLEGEAFVQASRDYSELEPVAQAARAVCELRFGTWSERVRTPLAPPLAVALERWQQGGFESVYGRPPVAGDWLVPRRSDPTQPHTEGSAYKAFRRACVALKLPLRSPRAIQNTFASEAEGGPRQTPSS